MDKHITAPNNEFVIFSSICSRTRGIGTVRERGRSFFENDTASTRNVNIDTKNLASLQNNRVKGKALGSFLL
jgi:hypothetical protein